MKSERDNVDERGKRLKEKRTWMSEHRWKREERGGRQNVDER